MKRALLALICMTVCAPCFADMPAIPQAYIAAGDGGRYYFKMALCEQSRWDFSCATGAVYEVSESGPDRLAWSTSGWFAYTTYLSYDGQYLVRIGNWPAGYEPSFNDLAIAFYNRGKLLKQYSTKELIKDVSQVPASVSHYEFLHEVRGFYRNTTRFFTIVMVDGTEYTFDVSNGEVLESRVALAGEALTWGEIAADAVRVKWIVIVVGVMLAFLVVLAMRRRTRASTGRPASPSAR